MGGAGRFWNNRKKQNTPITELSTLVIWPRYDPQLNYSIGGNFNIYPPTFSLDGRFTFYYAPGSFLSQNFRHSDPTLAGPILDQARPSGKQTLRQMAARRAKGSSNEYQTMIRLGEEWSMYKGATRILRKCRCLLRKATFRICMYSFTHLWYRMKKANICCCCMSIICRSRMAKAKQNAWFGFMFITAQYAPEMKSDQLCLS